MKVRSLPDAHNLELINYEGGQHTVGTEGNENIQELTDKLTATKQASGSP
ncbi:MAG: hypothetical protein IPF67_16590 [Saprospiraceae bacterium]|nr:hypothetical protein [Candidatus Brachybacter algidus]